jgi:general L-amino acid transport system permease protein
MNTAIVKPPPAPRLLEKLKRCQPAELVIQAALLFGIAAIIAFVVSNLLANAARLNIAMGFGFLERPAGFEIAQTLIAYPEGATYFRAFLVALINTIAIAAVSIAFSTILGFLVAIARLSSNPLLSWLARAYVETIRNIPLLLQLFFWYFAVLGSLPLTPPSNTILEVAIHNKRGLSIPAPTPNPSFPAIAVTTVAACLAAILLFRQARRYRIRTGHTSRSLRIASAACLPVPALASAILGSPISWNVPQLAGFNVNGGLSMIPEFVAMAVGMSVYGSAFVAEIVRGGISTVGRGQSEAARALGLRQGRIYSLVVVPQALRAIVPPLSAQYTSLLKTSSLAAAIGYPDLMMIFAGTALNQTGQPLQIMAMTMGTYLVLCLGTTAVANLINRRIQLVER